MQFSTALSIIINIFIYIHSCQAVYNNNAKSNVALYWGQGPGQQRLSYFCSQSTVDVIPIGFVDVFPTEGNGLPGTNFGNQCWGSPFVYPGPGSNPSLNQLQSECPNIAADIPICQRTYSKKIILSLGGATATNPIIGASAGIAFADFLWGAFGPQTAAWLASGQPRPFDGPNGEAVEVDGFDFDIEWPSPDSQEGLIAMASRLRILFQTASKPYLLTGAPQCITTPPSGDANMGLLIQAVAFDIIWVQFYNTPQCSARSWITTNPNYIDGQPEKASGFSYHEWTSFLAKGASKDAKLYLGVLGAPDAGNFYLSPTEISTLIDAYYCDPQFGGIMIWEATSAENNPTGPYQSQVKSILTGYDSKPPLPCAASIPGTAKTTSTTTTSSIFTQVSSTSGLHKVLTTSSKFATSKVPTSTNSPMTPTTSSKFATSKVPTSTNSPMAPTTRSKSTTSTFITKTTSKTTSNLVNALPTLSVPDGACGAPYGVCCKPGYCCSKWGYCGKAAIYCSTGLGCQSAFGTCN